MLDVVYTNTAPASSFRGFGAPQVTLAGESQMDEAAERLGIDASSSAGATSSRPGERPVAEGPRHRRRPRRGPRPRGRGARLGHAAAAPGRGRAICLSASDAGSEPMTTSDPAGPCRRLGDGDLRQHGDRPGVVDGARPDRGGRDGRRRSSGSISLQSDTAAVSYDRSTGASRTTTLMGLAIAGGGRATRARSWSSGRRRASRAGRPDGRRGPRRRPRRRRRSTIGGRSSGPGSAASAGEVVGRGYLRRSGATEEMPPFWEIGCVGVEVVGRRGDRRDPGREARDGRRRRLRDQPPARRGPGHRRGDDGPRDGDPRGARSTRTATS